ncbi:unnamed protein product, partial [Ixodes hexagonus]
MPEVASSILRTYGTHQLFLLMGALSLNALPAALFLRSPPWIASEISSKSPMIQKDTSSLELKEMRKIRHPLDDTAPDPQGEMEVMVRPSRPEVSCTKWDGRVPCENPMSSCLETALKQSNSTSELKATLKSFLTLRFQLSAFSYGVYFYTVTTFFLVHVDLARDRDVLPSQAIYLMHSYSAGDIVTRALIGVTLDRGYLTVHSAMALGQLGTAVACEALVWSSSTACLLLSVLLLGLSQGVICPLPSPIIIEDFGGRSLPILMGGMLGFIGLLLMTRPPVLG